MQDERIYKVALSLTPGVGRFMAKQLISYFGTAQKVFEAKKGQLRKVPRIGEKIATALLDQNLLHQAEGILEIACKSDVKLLFYNDLEYPNRLKRLMNAPYMLYYKGKADLNTDKVVSIVGTRKPTSYGQKVTEELVEALRSLDGNILVSSGLAYGIDITAHRHCLKQGIPTVGVMANGINQIYPSAHKNTVVNMLEQGGVLTENKPGTKPDAPLFPERNRIIAGMADVVIVTEAAEKGGALITAELANDFDVEVMAVPGNIDNKYSSGTNSLIRKNKAHPFTKIEDLVELMNWDNEKVEVSKSRLIMELDEEGMNIYEKLQEKDLHIDELSFRTNIPVNKLASALLTLEFQGIVKSKRGKRFGIA